MHSHGSSETDPADLGGRFRSRTLYAIVAAVLIPAALASLIAIVALWPSDASKQPPPQDFAVTGVKFLPGQVAAVTPFECQAVTQAPTSTSGAPATGPAQCARADIILESGTTVRVDITSQQLKSGLSAGDKVKVIQTPGIEGATPDYAFYDFVRQPPMLLLAIMFLVVVTLVARLKGLLSVVGLGFAFFILVEFMLPALLAGEPAALVGLAGSAAIMFVVLYLAHGFHVRTHTALMGTLIGLALMTGLAVWATGAAHLTGLSDDDGYQLAAIAPGLRLSDLVLCGMLVAGLGVLNDVTVTQASAVWELRIAAPDSSNWAAFRGAMRIGRDHIASTVYTIVFAYAGAALPVLLLISIYDRPLLDVLNSEQLAEEIVRTLVGAIGLVLAVPVTTAIGAVLSGAAIQRDPEAQEQGNEIAKRYSQTHAE